MRRVGGLLLALLAWVTSPAIQTVLARRTFSPQIGVRTPHHLGRPGIHWESKGPVIPVAGTFDATSASPKKKELLEKAHAALVEMEKRTEEQPVETEDAGNAEDLLDSSSADSAVVDDDPVIAVSGTYDSPKTRRKHHRASLVELPEREEPVKREWTSTVPQAERQLDAARAAWQQYELPAKQQPSSLAPRKMAALVQSRGAAPRANMVEDDAEDVVAVSGTFDDFAINAEKRARLAALPQLSSWPEEDTTRVAGAGGRHTVSYLEYGSTGKKNATAAAAGQNLLAPAGPTMRPALDMRSLVNPIPTKAPKIIGSDADHALEDTVDELMPDKNKITLVFSWVTLVCFLSGLCLPLSVCFCGVLKTPDPPEPQVLPSPSTAGSPVRGAQRAPEHTGT